MWGALMDGNREFRIIRARKLIMAWVRQNYAAYLLAGGRLRVYLLRCVRLRAGLGRVPFYCWLLLLLLCVPGRRAPSPVRKELRRNSKSDGYKFPFLRILLALGPLLLYQQRAVSCTGWSGSTAQTAGQQQQVA